MRAHNARTHEIYPHTCNCCQEHGVPTNPRMPEKLDILESAGLITQSRKADSRAVTISMTEMGHRISMTLKEIDEMMS